MLKKKPLNKYFVGIFRERFSGEEAKRYRLGVSKLCLHGQLVVSVEPHKGEQGRELWKFPLMNQFHFMKVNGNEAEEHYSRFPVDMDAVWLFEKPASREHDPTPVYEGKIVPFHYDATDNPKVDWNDAIRRMGSRGLGNRVDVTSDSAIYNTVRD
nr:hypothetical protein BaRGS_004529 [Batillaria attramentaria]